MSGRSPPDQSARDAAIDPRRSFIVRAPAGSGKTELLIQRHLRLLACVDEPEEVLAITFTRKAAAEMRDRIVAALEAASGEARAAGRMDPRTRELARAVLAGPQRRTWDLARHPARLNIATIDAVNAWLAGRGPLAGSAGFQRVTPWPEDLYRAAAQATLQLAGEDGAAGERSRRLLRHLDNDAARFVELLAALLPRREQWLRQVLRADRRREAMERPLRALVAAGLRPVVALWPADSAGELVLLLNHAAAQAGPGHAWGARDTMPAGGPADHAAWRAVADALLTADGAWRRRIDVSNGFAARDPLKPRMLALIARLADEARLAAALAAVRQLPDPTYPDAQWDVLNALLDQLPTAAALLQLEFASRGQADFPAIAAAAMDALGPADTPSEIGLALDVRIRHVLVDEFQDTSQSQFRLLEQLLEGWQPGDGRTLFLVGDPMQSIYGFRDADVRLFAIAEARGIGPLHPDRLQLSANFRALPELVDWVNATFSRLLPEVADGERGAVTFTAGEAARTDPGMGLAAWHWVPAGDAQRMAREVVDHALAARAAAPDGDVCVLVRARPHAALVLQELRRRQIPFSAPEVEDLGHSSVAQDLLALTRALTHRADRLAWLAVLRAPFCGLSLADLECIAGRDPQRDVWSLLEDDAIVVRLTDEARQRVVRLRQAVERAWSRRGGWPLRDVVEAAWLELGGPACLGEEAEIATAGTVFDVLDELDEGRDLADPPALTARLAKLTGSRGEPAAWLQVMTIHQAKGLEFGTVILPFLERQVRGSRRDLLLWYDAGQAPGDGEEDAGGGTIFAMLPEDDAAGERLYDALLDLRRQRDEFEAMRLLYVACTRAKVRLHLVAGIVSEEGEESARYPREPRRGSLLRHLWPVARDAAARGLASLPEAPPVDRRQPAWVEVPARPLPASWAPPAAAAAWVPVGEPPPATSEQDLEFDWASRWAMHVGSVVHRWLQEIADGGVARWSPAMVEERRPEFRRMLYELGTPAESLDRAEERVVAALRRTLADERGRWVLSGEHAEARSEVALTLHEGGRFQHVVVDRTFLTQAGERWVVDYKTSAHEGGDLDAFLALECERYRGQLSRYRDALTALGPEPVRTALYFPLLGEFREVPLEERRDQSEPAKVTE